MDYQKQLATAYRISTPLVNVRTFDAASAVRGIKSTLENITLKDGSKVDAGIILWDLMNGARHINKKGETVLKTMLKNANAEQDATGVLSEMLRISANLGEDSVLVISNAHLFWNDNSKAEFIQGVWNLRDVFKRNGSMLILLSVPGHHVPGELANDILILEEPLPTTEQLESIVKGVYSDAKFKEPDAATIKRATDALIGLPSFPAEQSAHMSLDLEKKTLDFDTLWKRKRDVINQTPGLTVLSGDNSLDNVGGLDNIKSFVKKFMAGKNAPNVVVFSDEIEKAVAGTGTDLSGVKTELTGELLPWSQDNDIDGLLLLGVPGVGKTELAKAIGATYGIPVIAFNIGACQDSLVGQSGARLRQALATLLAISGGRILWIGTCNSIDALVPELRSRFQLGTFFFDVPTDAERASIWSVYRQKFNLGDEKSNPRPNDSGWTGREIRECAKKSDRLGITLKEAAKYVVPTTISSRGIIDALRENSSGKYLSANHSGLFEFERSARVELEDGNTENGRKLRN